MAQSNVQFKIFADAAAAEAAIVRLEKKFMDLENSVSRVGRRSKQQADDVGGMFSKLAGMAGAAAAGLVTVGTAVAAGTAIWNRYSATLDQVADRQNRVNSSIAAAGVNLGTAGRAVDIKAAINAMPVAPEVGMAAFEGIQAGQPQLGLNAQLQLARQAAAMSPALVQAGNDGNLDTSKLRAFAETMSTLSQFVPKMQGGDLADLAIAMQGSVGGGNLAALRSGGFERAIDAMMKRGMSPEQALATASVGIDAGFESKGLLKEKAIAGLDQQRIAELTAQFSKATTENLAEQALMDVNRVNPQAFAQLGASRDLMGNEAPATELDALRKMQEIRYANARGFFESANAIVREPIENLGTRAMMAVGLDTGLRQTMQNVGAGEMQTMVSLLRENNDLMREQIRIEQGNVPVMNRQAHSE